jgi:HD-GYP domain-containing protein (c-di-GMP phosphodiesterase class II)
MLRVRKEDLRLGMFISSLEGSWFQHPFWKSKFLLTDMDDLRRLQVSEIDAVWIDKDQSVPQALAHLLGPKPVPQAGVAEAEPAAAPIAPPPEPRPARRRTVSEYSCAQQVLKDCKAAVADLFGRIGSGDAGAIEDAAPLVNGIAESVDRNPDALITLSRIRTLDEYSYLHSVAVSALMINLARQLQLPPDYVRQAGTAGLFMDVGKALLPPALLRKPGPFSAEDWAEMRRHPKLGADAIGASGELSKIVADVSLHHHERHDGSGYPHGLRGDEISLFARMAGLCDTYDALASARPHRPAFGGAEAVAEMYKLKGLFEESLLTSFIKSIGIYPVGSLVRMESRMLACVSAQRRDQLTRPVVRIFYSIAERAQVPVREVDLAQVPEPDRIVAREDPGRWGLADWDSFALTLLEGKQARRAA